MKTPRQRTHAQRMRDLNGFLYGKGIPFLVPKISLPDQALLTRLPDDSDLQPYAPTDLDMEKFDASH